MKEFFAIPENERLGLLEALYPIIQEALGVKCFELVQLSDASSFSKNQFPFGVKNKNGDYICKDDLTSIFQKVASFKEFDDLDAPSKKLVGTIARNLICPDEFDTHSHVNMPTWKQKMGTYLSGLLNKVHVLEDKQTVLIIVNLEMHDVVKIHKLITSADTSRSKYDEAVGYVLDKFVPVFKELRLIQHVLDLHENISAKNPEFNLLDNDYEDPAFPFLYDTSTLLVDLLTVDAHTSLPK